MIISISGKINSGKDLVGKIIQGLFLEAESMDFKLSSVNLNSKRVENFPYPMKKKFAAKLKQMVALMIGCDMIDLENREFKNSYLSPEWWVYKNDEGDILPYFHVTSTEASKLLEGHNYVLVKTTPRLLMKTLAEDCVRRKISPNAWIISTVSDYTDEQDWIITDTRYPNEIAAIKSKCSNPLFLKVVRLKTCREWYEEDFKNLVTLTQNNWITHYSWEIEKVPMEIFIERITLCEGFEPSKEYHLFLEERFSIPETALDSFEEFDEIVYNGASIDDLIDNIRAILKVRNLI
jgi:hypothetical protein